MLNGRLSVPRSNCFPVAVGTLLLCAGGSGSSGVSAVVDIYDNVLNIWSSASLSVARCLLAGAAVGSKAIWAGGLNNAGAAVNAIDIYDLATKLWTTSALHTARWYLNGGIGNGKSMAKAVDFVSFDANSGSSSASVDVCSCNIKRDPTACDLALTYTDTHSAAFFTLVDVKNALFILGVACSTFFLLVLIVLTFMHYGALLSNSIVQEVPTDAFYASLDSETSNQHAPNQVIDV